MNQAEVQKSWGWPVILYIFLAGSGGGTYLFSFIFTLLGLYAPVARLGLLMGPLMVVIGTVLLIVELGSPVRTWRLFTTPATLLSSWMIRGAWILIAFIILGLLYALPAFSLFQWLPWNQASGSGLIIGIISAVLAIIVPLYPGMLLGVIKSIPLWNTAALPPLFFLSGLDTGVATLGLTALFFSDSLGVAGFHLLAILDIVLIILLLIALGAYLEIVRQTGVTGAASIQLLRNRVFIIGVILFGLLFPLALLIFNVLHSNLQLILVLEAFIVVFILSGGLLLRYNVVRSGLRISLR